MASIGLRIRQPGNIGVNVSGLADSLASAFFGDAGTEMALAKMRSQLATDAYQRQQMWAAAQLNEAKTATEEQNLRWRQGAVDPLGKVLFDAQGRPVAGDAGPAPVVLPESTQAIPQLRPGDAADYVPPTSYASTEPDVQVSPANYPLRSDQPAPVAAGPGGVEPDMSFGAYGVPEGGAVLPAAAPIPARRPGDMPDIAAYLHGAPSLPEELMPGAQAAPVNTVRPERAGDLRPTIIDSGSPSTFPARPELPGSLAPTGVPLADLFSSFPPRPAQIGSNVMPYQLPPGAVPATGDSFLTLGDLWNHLIGQPPRRPEFDQPVSFGGDSGPATPFYNEEGLRNLIANGGREGTRGNAQLIPPDRPSIWSAPGPFPARPGAPAPEMAPAPVDLQPRPPQETGRRPGDFPPFEPNQALQGPPPPQLRPALPPGAYPAPSLAGVPPDLLPTPVDVPLPGYVLNEGLPQDVPPELTPMTGGTSVAVPGRNPPMPDTRQLAGVPPELRGPAQPGGPAVVVPGRTSQETVRDRPPPVSPDYPIAPDAYPVSATGDVILEPSTQTVVVHTQSGGPVRLTLDEARAIAGGIMGSSTSGADLASGTGRMAGLLGLTYGDPNNPDRQRISSELYTGDAPTTSTMITSQDTAPATFEAQKAAVTPGDPKKNIQIIDNKAYEVSFDAKGHPVLTPMPLGPEGTTPTDYVRDIPGTAAEVSYINTLAETAYKMQHGLPVDDAEKLNYGIVYSQLYGKKAQLSTTPEGRQLITVLEQLPPPGIISPAGGPQEAPAAAPAATAPAAAAAAPNAPAAPAGDAAAAPAATPPATAAAAQPGQPTLGTDLYGNPIVQSHVSKVNGQDVKNYGGWTGDGEAVPTTTTKQDVPGYTATQTTSGNRKQKAASVEAEKDYRMLYQSIDAAKVLNEMSKNGQIPGRMQSVYTRLMEEADGIPMEAAMKLFQDEDSRRWARAIYVFINGQLRPDTGAAISQKEFKIYRDMFIPPPNATPQDILDTMNFRTRAQRAIRAGLNDQVPDDQLRELDMQLHAAGLDLDWTSAAGQRVLDAAKKNQPASGGRVVSPRADGGFDERPQ